MSKKESTTNDEQLPTRKQYRRRQQRRELFGRFGLHGEPKASETEETPVQPESEVNDTASLAEEQAEEHKAAATPEAVDEPAKEAESVATMASAAADKPTATASTAEHDDHQAMSAAVSAAKTPHVISNQWAGYGDQATPQSVTSEAPRPLEDLLNGTQVITPVTKHMVNEVTSAAKPADSAATVVTPTSGNEQADGDKPVASAEPVQHQQASPVASQAEVTEAPVEAVTSTLSEPDEPLRTVPKATVHDEDLGAIVEQPGFEAGDVSDQEQILRGTGWMTAASITSRVLGALYIIPWVMWFGTFYNQANALFSKGYNVYSIVLMVSTAGIPAAISKLIAHYNALNEYGVGFRLFKRGMMLSLITGIVAALLLWILAPSQLLTTGDPNVIPVLRSLTLAVFVFPTLSMMRGMFQGYHMMAPSAISQFIEQVVRVIYMLLTAYLIMEVGNAPAKNWPHTVVQSTFAAGLGAIVAVGVLAYQMWRYRGYFRNKIAGSQEGIIMSTPQLLKQIIWQAIPFTIVPSAIAIYQLFDQMTFFKIMHVTSNLSYAAQNTLYAYFDFNANKIIMITVSLASALAATAIPLLTEAHTLKDNSGTSKQINFTLELFSFIMIPASLGMAAIAVPLYTVFYRYSLAGSVILEFSAYLGILFGLFTVLSTVMQGVDENRAVIWYMVVGLIVKMVLQFPMVALAQPMGPLLATTAGFGVSCFLIFRNLDRHFDIDYDGLLQKVNQIIIFSLATFVVARLSVWGLDHVMNTQFKSLAFLEVLIAMLLGGGVYIYLALRTRLADEMLGDRVAGLRQRLHIK
ncbi:putative polysaccharide biosynthesis protein [Furfurilactobacillus entadae]|uniref:putative polysaccharide biosynthesis protein n=1 Tax=Furfurilactobacillus entadae TaxID=2922307 RepID=UPI0035E6C486